MGLKTATLGFLMIAAATAPEGPPADKQAIRRQCGCFEVTYQFAETFALAPGYKPKEPKRVGGLEWIEADGEDADSLSLQHILVVPDGAQKHWRQEWDYQPDYIFDYKGDGLWVKRRLSPEAVRGKWVQRVYEVDDSPRYEGLGPWIRTNDKTYWEAEAWSPLPRREFTTRSDYNVLARRNRHALTNDGWVHEQDNVKLKVDGTTQTPLVQEKGLNTYRRVDDARCDAARRWWQANKGNWHKVQAVWDELYEKSDRIHLMREKDGVALWERLFKLAERPASEQATLKGDVRAAIREYQVK